MKFVDISNWKLILQKQRLWTPLKSQCDFSLLPPQEYTNLYLTPLLTEQNQIWLPWNSIDIVRKNYIYIAFNSQ